MVLKDERLVECHKNDTKKLHCDVLLLHAQPQESSRNNTS